MKIKLQTLENTFYSSDLHLYHKSMLRYGRDFDNVDEMNESIVTNWNKKVKKDSKVFLIGDVSFANKAKTSDILDRLNGEIYIVLGNHDEISKLKHNKVVSICDYLEISCGDYFIVLSHFPFEVWNKRQHQSWHLHGHCHGSLVLENDSQKRIDVGIDCSPSFSPFSFSEIEEMMRDRYNVKKDHHDKNKNVWWKKSLKNIGYKLIKLGD